MAHHVLPLDSSVILQGSIEKWLWTQEAESMLGSGETKLLWPQLQLTLTPSAYGLFPTIYCTILKAGILGDQLFCFQLKTQ